MNPIYYIFFAVYSFLHSINGIVKNNSIEWSAMFITCGILGLNIFTIDSILEIQFGISIIQKDIGAIIMGAIVLTLNYYIFLRKQRYLVIVAKYSGRSNTISGFLVLIYIILSIWLFFHFADQVRELKLTTTSIDLL